MSCYIVDSEILQISPYYKCSNIYLFIIDKIFIKFCLIYSID